MWFWLSGFLFALAFTVPLCYHLRNKNEMLSKHIDTLQFCLDLCEEWASQFTTKGEESE